MGGLRGAAEIVRLSLMVLEGIVLFIAHISEICSRSNHTHDLK